MDGWMDWKELKGKRIKKKEQIQLREKERKKGSKNENENRKETGTKAKGNKGIVKKENNMRKTLN